MRITKYNHSCLLIEYDGTVYLIDPGKFSCQDAVMDIKTLPRLDYILYTHSHTDHFMLPCLKEIMNSHEYVQVITNESLKNELVKNEIDAVTETPEGVDMFYAKHEDTPFSSDVPENVGFHMFDLLTNPGDSFMVDRTNPILTLPIQAPWGSMTKAFKTAERLGPDYIIPMHDWHWNEKARKNLLEASQEYFKKKDIEFLIPENGTPLEVNL